MKPKKISKLLIGTNNKGKLREIKALLPKNIKIFSTSDFNLKSPKENGKTFKENSFIKAKFFSKKSDQICISDDSGLEIKILNLEKILECMKQCNEVYHCLGTNINNIENV